MAGSLVPFLLASLVQGATADADVGLRLESTTSTVDDVRVSTATRTALSAIGTASGIVDTSPLRLTATYAPRMWSSDVDLHPSPLFNHEVNARVETQPDGSWRFSATAGAARGWTDPLLQAGAAGATAPIQLATTRPMEYEDLNGRVGLEVPLGLRTTIASSAGFDLSRSLGSDAGLAPLQRSASGSLSLGRVVTERDSLELGVNGTMTVTDLAGSTPNRGETLTALVTWRRRLSPTLDGWLGGGASWLHSSPLEVVPGRRTMLQPAAEVGLRGGDVQRYTISALVQETTFVDRFSGQLAPAVLARCDVTWRASDRLSLSFAGSGGSRTDGVTSVAAATVQASWRLREALSFALGVQGFGQRETQPGVPSFVEVAVLASIAYTRERILGNIAPSAAGLPGAPDEAGAAPGAGGMPGSP